MNDQTVKNDSVEDEPIVPDNDDDALTDPVDGEAVVVPGQRPGPTEPLPS